MPRGSDRGRRRTAGGLAFSAVVLTVGVGAGTAWAAVTDNIFPTSNAWGTCSNDPDGGDGDVTCLTDNSQLTYYMDSSGTYELESPDRTAVRSTMNNDYAPTDLSVSYDSSPAFSGNAETDVVYQEGSTNLPSSADGVTWCNDAVDNDALECDQQYVRIRGNGHYTRGLSCHETGHAVGLLHGNQAYPALSKTDSRLGCMVTPVGAGTGLGSNNRDNINSMY
ncbi:hypothetical protein V1L54_24000 [Streptomyces sp. TRM 70361]|uniref:hypothetical protein n=1 Tax=Streptomyces sp. TRM 70361 TaxID=3116553 RepID=UPI002E7AF9AD|nr:hypothetical protein [Streptomyces sp. TRM 70361]MEE1942427.1 hypothetical protein [Streptomyces sp. TRM 70361]